MEAVSKRIVYFDYLRLLAAFAVVTLHVAASYYYKVDTRSLEWNAYNLYDGASRWSVPVFVMISGALFLEKKKSFEQVFRGPILKMIIVFCFWSAAYAFWGYSVIGSIKTFKAFIREFIVGKSHLWFLPMIIGLYMIVPFLDMIIEDKKKTKMFLVLSFMFSFLIPQVVDIIGLVNEGLSEALSKLISNANVHFMIGYSGYYILGFILHRTELNKKQEWYIYTAGLGGLAFTIGATSLISYLRKTPIHFYGNLTVNTLLVAVAVFFFGKQHLCRVPRSDRWINRLTYLSKCTFGVYLVHVFVLDSLRVFFGLTVRSFNAIISVPAISLLVFCISLMISGILNRIPLVNKWLV